MRRTILLFATAALVLLLVGGVAASKQREEQSIPSSKSPTTETTTDKGIGDVSIQSTTQKASFTNGSGANFLRVAVSDHGNLLAFESPQDRQSVSTEGYALCSDGFSTVHGYDSGGDELGFGTPTFSQPNGAGKFPLTVTRTTTDGKFRLKQVWAKPDATEKDVTVTMTVTNLSSSTINRVALARLADIDAGGFDSVGGTGFTDRGTRTDDATIQWDDYGDGGQVQIGLVLTALTFQTTHIPWIETLNGFNYSGCNPTNTLFGPTTRQDLAMRMIYHPGNIAAGASKTVKYEYSRM